MRRIAVLDDIEEGTAYLKTRCDKLAAMIEVAGDIPLRLSSPGFEGLASIIVSQQVSKASAEAIFTRLKKSVQPLTAQNFINAGEETWRAVGLSRPKQRTLTAISEAAISGALDLRNLCELPPDDALAQMTAIKGIGPWTGEVYLMFCAGHSDIFPAGDLALQEAMRLGYNMRKRPDEKTARKRAARWKPWRAVAARVLWAYYGKVKRDATPV